MLFHVFFYRFYQGESNDPPLQKLKTRKLRKVKIR